MKHWYSDKKLSRSFYLVGFIFLVAGMLLSMAMTPATAAGQADPTAEETQTQPPPAEQPRVYFAVDSTAVCQMDPGPLSADVTVVLPAGVQAVLQTAWKVAEPADLRTDEVYNTQTVTNGSVVTVTGQWPGIRATDAVVEIHLGAILLDMDGNPISAGTGMDFYWYPWFCPVAAPATQVPTEVPTVEPTVAPTEVSPTEVPTTAPTSVVPTEYPTVAPTAPGGTPVVTINLPDTAVCQMVPGMLSADVTVTLPPGVSTAVLEWAYKIAEPVDLRTDEVYNFVTVTNGQTVTMTGMWPGVRAQDQVVEIHLGAILLDAVTMNPISDARGMDFYWYPWFCPFTGEATSVPTVNPTESPTEVPTEILPTVVPTEVPPTAVPTEVPTEVSPTEVPTSMPGTPVVTFPGDQAVCVMDAGPMTTQVTVSLPEGQQAILQTSWRVSEPAGKRTQDVYAERLVKNGDVVMITGQWPGVSAGDTVVAIHFGAILLDTNTRAPISAGAGVDYYWYDWVCPGPVSPTATVPVDVVAPAAAPAQSPSFFDVLNAFWTRILTALGW